MDIETICRYNYTPRYRPQVFFKSPIIAKITKRNCRTKYTKN